MAHFVAKGLFFKWIFEFITNKVDPVSLFGAKLHLGSNFGLIWNDYLMEKCFWKVPNPNC